MLASIAAILVVVWFYRTAEVSGKEPVSWTASGAIVYFLAALFWTYFINPPIKDNALHNPSGFMVTVVQYAYIVFALACTAGFKILMSDKPVDENSSE